MAIAQFFGGLAEEFGKTLKMGAILEAKSDQARRQEEQQFKLLEREDELKSKRLFQKQEFDRETKLLVTREEAMEKAKLQKDMFTLGTTRTKQVLKWLGLRFPGENIDASEVNPLELQEVDQGVGGIEQAIDRNPPMGKQGMESLGFRFVPKVTLGEKGGVSVSLQRLAPGEKLTPEGFAVAGELKLPRFTDQWSDADFAKFNKAMEAKEGRRAARGRAPVSTIENITKQIVEKGWDSLNEDQRLVWRQFKGLKPEVKAAIEQASASVESDILMGRLDFFMSSTAKAAATYERAIEALNNPKFYESVGIEPPERLQDSIAEIHEQMRKHGMLTGGEVPSAKTKEKGPTLKIESPEEKMERFRKKHRF